MSRGGDAAAIVRDYVKALHRYNETKDIAHSLAEIIAEQNGVRVVEVFKELGAEASDG
jgi:hypothetical protein